MKHFFEKNHQLIETITATLVTLFFLFFVLYYNLPLFDQQPIIVFYLVLLLSIISLFLFGPIVNFLSILCVAAVIIASQLGGFFNYPSHLNVEQMTLIIFFTLVIQLLFINRERNLTKIKKQAALFQTIADFSADPIVLKNTKGQIIYASPTIKNTLGYPPSHLAHHDITKHLHPDDLKTYHFFYQKVLKSPSQLQSVELRLKHKYQGWTWFRNEAINLLHIPEVKAVVATFHDITHRKKIDEKMKQSLAREKQARADAEKAVKMRDEFLSIASHELKTPLTTILLHLRANLKRILTQSLASFSGEQLAVSLQTVEQQSYRLSVMIKDLLNISLISTGRVQLETQSGKLGSLIQNVIKNFEEQLQQSGSKVILDIRRDVSGEWDLIRVEQIITNLLTNAIKYGRGKPITITLDKHQDQAVITIADQGVGISLEDQARVFDLFHRAENSNGKKGLGVGLYIARQLARSHYGDVSVSSEPEKGSTFTIILPTHQPVQSASQ